MRTFGVIIAFGVAWAIRREIFEGRRPNLTASFWFVIAAGLFYGPSGSEALLVALGVAGSAAMHGRVASGEPNTSSPTSVPA